MPENPREDKAQIGLTPTAAAQLDRIMELGWFEDRQDAYRLAIGVALARGIAVPAQDLRHVETRYNFMGGVDRDGKLRTLIAVLAPEESLRPAAYSERLAHAGIAYLIDRFENGRATLSEALGSTDGVAGDEQPRAPTPDARVE